MPQASSASDDSLAAPSTHGLVASAVDAMPDVSLLVLDRTMRLVALHGGALARHGHDPEAMLGRRADDVVAAEAWQVWGPLCERALAGETVVHRTAGRNGQLAREATLRPILVDGQVTGASIMTKDLSDAQAQLHAFRLLTEISTNVITRWTVDGRCLYASPAIEALLGTPADDWVGRRPVHRVHQDDRPRLAALHQDLLRSHRPASLEEVRLSHANGGWLWFDLELRPVVDEQTGAIVELHASARDTTERRARERAKAERDAARELFAAAFETAPVGMCIARSLGKGSLALLECNAAFRSMLGYADHPLPLGVFCAVFHADDLVARDELLRDALAGRRPTAELRMRHREGHDVWALLAPATVTDADGGQLVVIQATDISERKSYEAELRRLADRDDLTGLLSRRRFEQELHAEAQAVAARARPSALLLIDLDGFKVVNDTYGHLTGDELLCRIAAEVSNEVRPGDVVARIGGDEFAILLPAADALEAERVARRLVAAVRRTSHVTATGRQAQVTTSVGVTVMVPGDDVDVERLLAEADIALYGAKHAGRDDVLVYDRSAGLREALIRHAADDAASPTP